MIYRQLWDILARNGLERIEAAGKPFDPHFHQAIERVETTEHPDGTVVEVLQDGFVSTTRVCVRAWCAYRCTPMAASPPRSGTASSFLR